MAMRADRLARERRRLPLATDGPCTLCGFGYAHVAYYVVWDQDLLGMISREGQRPVRLCRRCAAKPSSRHCQHCGEKELYSVDTPLAERPVAYWLRDCRGGAAIAPECINDACDPYAAACYTCHARPWQQRLYQNRHDYVHLCKQCMLDDGLAPCAGDRDCTRLISSAQRYCGKCKLSHPDGDRPIKRCADARCWKPVEGAARMCVRHARKKRH